jgi:hypothetical protein
LTSSAPRFQISDLGGKRKGRWAGQATTELERQSCQSHPNEVGNLNQLAFVSVGREAVNTNIGKAHAVQ